MVQYRENGKFQREGCVFILTFHFASSMFLCLFSGSAPGGAQHSGSAGEKEGQEAERNEEETASPASGWVRKQQVGAIRTFPGLPPVRPAHKIRTIPPPIRN